MQRILSTALLLAAGLASTTAAEALLRTPDPSTSDLATTPQSSSFDERMARGIEALNQGELDLAAAAFREALTLEPDHPGAQTMLGTVLLGLGDPSAALDQLRRAAAALPDHYPARAGLARAYLELGRDQEALTELEAAVGLEPDDSGSRARLATLLLRLGRADAAAGHARELASRLPEQAGVHRLLGVAELARGEDGAALVAFDDALALRPDDPDARYGRAAALRGLERPAEAVEVLDALVADHPDRADAWTLLGDIFAARDDIESKLAAVGMYRTALEQRPDDVRVTASLFDLLAAASLTEAADELLTGSAAPDRDPALAMRLGRLRFEQERFDDAAAAYRRAIDLGAGGDAWYRLGVVQVNLAELEAAEASFRRSLEMAPDMAVATRELGKVLLDRGRTAEADALLGPLTEQLPDDAATWYLAGMAAARTGDHDRAVDAFRQAVVSDPDHADAHYNLGLSLRQTGDTDAAREALSRAQELRRVADDAPEAPANERAAAAFRAGFLRYRIGSLDHAAQWLEQATRLDPELDGAWLYLGLTRTAQGRADEAIAAVERATEIDPENVEAWEILARLYEQAGRVGDAERARANAAAHRDGTG